MTAENKVIEAARKLLEDMQLAEIYDVWEFGKQYPSPENKIIEIVLIEELENRLSPKQFKEWYEDNVK